MKETNIPLTDPRISDEMRQFMSKNGFRAIERDGCLSVIWEETDGEVCELGYNLFCAVTRAHYADKLQN